MVSMETFLKKALIVYLKENAGLVTTTDNIMTYMSAKAHGSGKGIFSVIGGATESLYVVSYFNNHQKFYVKQFNRADKNIKSTGVEISEDLVDKI